MTADGDYVVGKGATVVPSEGRITMDHQGRLDYSPFSEWNKTESQENAFLACGVTTTANMRGCFYSFSPFVIVLVLNILIFVSIPH